MNKKIVTILLSLFFLVSCSNNVSSSQIVDLQTSSLTISTSSSQALIEEKPKLNFNFSALKRYVLETYWNDKNLSVYKNSTYRIANKTLPDFLMTVDRFIFVPAQKDLGFGIPYVIRFPSGRYKNENIGLNKHFILANYTSMSNPDFEYGFFQYINQNVYDGQPRDNDLEDNIGIKTSELLDSPMLTPIVTWQRALLGNELVLNTNLDRESIFATYENMKNYLKVEYNSNQRIYESKFEEYEYDGMVDLEQQFEAIIKHSTELLRKFSYEIEDKVFMTGFSATGNFTQRFTTFYPELVRAYFAGGIMFPILPGNRFEQFDLNYPLGTNEHKTIYGKDFDLQAYNKVAKINYVSKFEDRYSPFDGYVLRTIESMIVKESNFEFNNSSRPEKTLTYWQRNFEIFKALGGEGMFMYNDLTGHYLDDDDFQFSIDFFKMNSIDDIPTYPKSSPYKQHLILE
jgi:hypothetical protein